MDVKQLAERVFENVAAYLAKSLAPLADRIKALEERAPVAGDRGPKGDPGEPGERGDPGRDGKSVTLEDVAGLVELGVAKGLLDLERRATEVLQRAAERIPVPANGKDGRDGFGFEDFDVVFDGERGLTLRFERGDHVKEFKVALPIVIDRGVYREGETYARCDGATYGGSYWIAQKDAPEGRPGLSDDWRLAVKRGRDGKDGRDGIDKTSPVKL